MARKIGKYEIQDEIGKGGFGSVYRAHDPTIGRTVAIKVLSVGDDPSVLSRFRSEAAAAGKLHHQNIVTIHDFGEHQGEPFLVMEFLEGEDLHKTISRRRVLSRIDQLQIISQIAEGLRCAHKNGVVHRDIKPANIMLQPDGGVKIMDFGIARIADPDATRQTKTGLLVGTVYYISPEQLQGGEATALADIWSFGVICYELLTGVHPFRAPDMARLMYKIISEEPESIRSLVPDCSEALATVISKALSKHCETRYQSFDDLLFDLRPIVVEEQERWTQDTLAQASVLFKQDAWDEALSMVEKVLGRDPANRGARQLRESIQQKVQRRALRPRVDAILKAAEADFQSRNFDSALRSYESAARLDPADTVVRARVEEVREAIDKSRKALQLLRDARNELQHQNLTRAFRYATEAVHSDPNEPEAEALLRTIESEIKKKNSEKALQDGIAKAKGLLLIDAFDQAVEVLTGLTSSYPESTVVTDLLAQARAEKVHREKRGELEREVETAKECVKNARFADAVDILKRLSEEFPDSREVPRLLSYAEEERQAQQHRQLIEDIRRNAQVLIESEKFDEAVQLLDGALKTYKGEDALVRLLESAAASRAIRDRARAIHEVRSRCEQLEHDGRLQEALQCVEGGLREHAGDSQLAGIRDRLKKDWEQRQRSEAIKTTLTKAGSLIDAEQWTQALDLLNRACSQYPDSDELLALQSRTAANKEERRFVEKQLAAAKELEKRQEFQSALNVIDAALEQYPNAPALVAERDRVSAAAETYQWDQNFARQRSEIERLIATGRLADALVLIQAAQVSYPDQQILRELYKRVQSTIEAQEREADVARRTEAIQRAIDANDFPLAVQLITSAQEAHPEESRFGRLYSEAKKRFESLRAAERKQEIERRVEAIERALEARNYPQAWDFIQAAQKVHPAEPVFATLLDKTKRAEEQQRAERNRQDIEARRAAIDRALSDSNFKQAFELIDSAQRAFPGERIFTQLLADAKQTQSDKLAEETSRDVAQRHGVIVQAIAAGQFGEALTLIGAAQQAHPHERVFQQLLDDARRGQEEARANQRNQEIAQTRLEIERALSAQDTAKASDLISVARRQYPDQPVFNRLLEDLNALVYNKNIEEAIAGVQANLEARTPRKAKEILTRALKAYPKEERLRPFSQVVERAEKYQSCMEAAQNELARSRFAAAEKAAREALKQRPDDSGAEALLKKIDFERFQSEERKHHQRGRSEIEKLLGNREFDVAAEKLRQMLVRFPRDPELEKMLKSAETGAEGAAKERLAGEAATVQADRSAVAEHDADDQGSSFAPVWAAIARAKWVIALVLVVIAAAGIAWIYHQQSESDRRKAIEQARQEEAERQARKNEIATLAEQERQARQKLEELKRAQQELQKQPSNNKPGTEAKKKDLDQQIAKQKAIELSAERQKREKEKADEAAKAQQQQQEQLRLQQQQQQRQDKADREKVDREKAAERQRIEQEKAQQEAEAQKAERLRREQEAIANKPWTGAARGNVVWSGELEPNKELTIGPGSTVSNGQLTAGFWPRTAVDVSINPPIHHAVGTLTLVIRNDTSEVIRKITIQWTAKHVQ